MPEWPSYGNFGRVTQNPHFLKKYKGGTKGNFSKIAYTVALAYKAPQHSSAKGIILLLVCNYRAKTGKDFGAKKRLQKCPNGQVTALFARSPKTRIFWKKQRGDHGKFFKNRPKSNPRFNGPTALWRKWHYPLISVHLKCKDWRIFWPKQRLQKCPNRQVMAIFGKVTQNQHFLKKWKTGGPKEIFQKSPKK